MRVSLFKKKISAGKAPNYQTRQKKLIYHYSNIKNIINLAVPFFFHMYPTSTQRRLQGLHDKLLHFGHIFLFQILQSHAEGGLQHTIIQATTNDARAQTAVYQGFVERACSSAHHQVIQEPGTDGLQVTFLLEKYVQKEAGIASEKPQENPSKGLGFRMFVPFPLI